LNADIPTSSKRVERQFAHSAITETSDATAVYSAAGTQTATYIGIGAFFGAIIGSRTPAPFTGLGILGGVIGGGTIGAIKGYEYGKSLPEPAPEPQESAPAPPQ